MLVLLLCGNAAHIKVHKEFRFVEAFLMLRSEIEVFKVLFSYATVSRVTVSVVNINLFIPGCYFFLRRVLALGSCWIFPQRRFLNSRQCQLSFSVTRVSSAGGPGKYWWQGLSFGPLDGHVSTVG